MEGIQMTSTANAAIPASQTVLPMFITQLTDQIDFAPTAPGKKIPLRSWERQPSTPFLARHKSRKIWKRFRKSMEAIRSRTAPSTATSQIEESDFANEISQSANAAYLRAVKRQRVLAHMQTERGGSFLETKWELEIGKRKRKLVGRPEDQQLVANGQEDENEADGDNLAQSLDEFSQPVGLTAAADAEENNTSDDDDTDRSAVISEIVDLAIDAQGGQVSAEVRELIAKQEPSLVRSALRMNSLDGEDVALLSEFLSRAQAKRAANAVMASCEESEARQKMEVSSPAVQSRRALEELDVNSPSIQKPVILTPVKTEKLPESPDASEPTNDDTRDFTSSPTVACRRSTRTKPTTQQTRSLRPAVPNQIPVRRANGTEFVFLQRTEAQELALTTRKNTRRNKGNALLPRYLLQAILKHERKDGTMQPFAQLEEKDTSRQSPRKRSSKPKQVCWKEDKLVEYAPEKISVSIESPSPSKKKSSSSRREGSKSTAATTQALPATPSKKVRRINLPASSSDDTSARAFKPMPAGTPIPKRKKLTPRLKSTSESSSSRSSRDTVPAAAPTTKTATKQAPSSQQSLPKISGIPRSKTLIKPPVSSTPATSAAGATPIVKRVRARRAAV
ncbi:conserved hypothetical protein [Talaromyces stipitatus ATCC 10500]|uniref:Uncharacterized protein n=1 Tax=Talaromyces stipitatus (strain ATCC 10500 / CBS 375.48 / QM 6759 / NRRL 1006) TaxID=441959 RepID=B8LWC0_TALSN|nr:uncharacterized protein TSTA_076030 [Talaromyces stipitatus ATCC 10500]EED24231.1 conserved hypothetical protein [Talaromyces stipitatus ATCC 10500]